MVTLRRADGGDLAYVEGLLADEGLPTRDVRSSPGRFYVAQADGDRVGVGGLELYDTDGLVRSVVVEPSARANGYGTALCGALEAEACDAGVETVYLLTTTAADFFAARGYVDVERAELPPAIRETTEFAELCPSTAVAMRKSLVRESGHASDR